MAPSLAMSVLADAYLHPHLELGLGLGLDLDLRSHLELELELELKFSDATRGIEPSHPIITDELPWCVLVCQQFGEITAATWSTSRHLLIGMNEGGPIERPLPRRYVLQTATTWIIKF